MAVIGFSDRPEDIWCVAGWAFRQVLDDTIARHPEDSELAREFEVAKALSGLHIDSLKPDIAVRVTNAISHTVTEILSGAFRSGIYEQSYSDAQSIEGYRNAVQELLKIFNRQGLR